MASDDGRSPLLSSEIDNMSSRPEIGESEYQYENAPEDEVVLTGCGATPCCDPRRSGHRFFVLMFMCFLGFGSYFCYDNPGAMQDYFITDMGINTQEFSLLYAWYSWPNVFLCFVGGFLIDRFFGIRLGAIIFATFVLIGQLIFATGGLVDKFWLMEAGRFVFGIGGESLAVAQNTYAVSWFQGKELNMVFGLQLSFARVGSTVNFNVMGPIYEAINVIYPVGYTALGVSLMIASVTCALSLFCALTLGYFDRRAERICKKKDVKNDQVHLSDIKDFPMSFWLICLICVSYYVAIFPFIGLGKVFFERKFEFAPGAANAVNSIVYIISAIASPVLGFMVDRVGRNILFVILAVLITIVAHGLLAFTFLNPYVPMCLMGVGYSLLASALWPMISMVIPEYQLGTAYGIMQSVQNLGLAVITMIAGMLVDSHGYLILEVFFLAWLCICFMCSVWMWVADYSRGGFLNMPVSERDILEQQKLIAATAAHDRILAEGGISDVSQYGILPSSEFHLRNKFLSRIGAALPAHYDPAIRALRVPVRALR